MATLKSHVLIHGRPFLCTSKAPIDMDGGEITLRIGNEKLTNSLVEAMRHSFDYDDACYFHEVTDRLIDENVQEITHRDPFGRWPEEEIAKEASPVEKKHNRSTPGMLKKMWRKVTTPRPTRKKFSIDEAYDPCVSPSPDVKLPYPTLETYTYCLNDFKNVECYS